MLRRQDSQQIYPSDLLYITSIRHDFIAKVIYKEKKDSKSMSFKI